MTDATCPVCGTQCRIQGDPSSVTRWYEPLGQAELEAAQDHTLSLEKLIESLRIDRNAATERVAKLETKLHGMTATMQQWRNLAKAVSEERDALCICGHPLSKHDENVLDVGCWQRVSETFPRYCDCDVFKARKVEE